MLNETDSTTLLSPTNNIHILDHGVTMRMEMKYPYKNYCSLLLNSMQ